MTKHTAEPWTATDIGTLHGKDSQFIAELGGMRAEADLRRIAACVNACAGISTQQLEAFAFVMRPGSDRPFDRLATKEAWRKLRVAQATP
jgi:hypothetical protein